MPKKKKYKYRTLKWNLSDIRWEKYLAILRRRYDRPRSGLARLALMALKEIIAMETENPIHGKT